MLVLALGWALGPQPRPLTKDGLVFGDTKTHRGSKQTPTLQRLCSVLLDHYGELQDQLGSRLQEGLQQPQHVDVRVLEHHGPVPPPLVLLLTPRHDPQVQGPDVPAGATALITDHNTLN